MWDLAFSDPRVVGPYRTRAVLGEGGMGRVLLACAPRGDLVAVKLVRGAFAAHDDSFRRRLHREAVAARRVHSSGTARVIDADTGAGVPWLAYEFHRGPTLLSALSAAGPLPEETVLRLGSGLAAALRDIHAADFLHRDLSAANVLLTDTGPVVIDVGVARQTQAPEGSSEQTELVTVTQTGMVVGNPGFMSPEQAMGLSDLAPASDIFSLGILLAMAATGRNPFQGPTGERTRLNVMLATPDLSSLPPRLRTVVEPCLAREPGRRPDAGAVLSAIGAPPGAEHAWPEPVRALAEQQSAELARYTEVEPTTILPGPRDLDPTRIFTTGAEPGTHPGPPPAEAPGTHRPKRRAGLLAVAAAATAVVLAVPLVISLRDGEAVPKQPAASAADAFPVTVEHDYGETTIQAPPKRVAVWGWGAAEAAIALGTFPVGIPGKESDDGVELLPWMAQAYEDRGADAPVLFDQGTRTTAVPSVQIAATDPDLVLAPYSGLTEEQYEELSDIAPVVARPVGASVEPWEGVIDITATALGVADKGEELLAETDAQLAGLGEQHGLTGLTFAAIVNYPPGGIIKVYSDANPVVRVLEGLGMRLADPVVELDTEDDGLLYDLDYEEMDRLESDVLVLVSSTSELAELDMANEELNAVPAFAAGRVTQVFGFEEMAAVTAPTVLSISWPGGVPVLAESLAGVAVN